MEDSRSENQGDTPAAASTETSKAEESYTKSEPVSVFSAPVWKLKNFATIFGKPSENNITFCIDTSGSMYNVLESVKDQLIEVLFQKAQDPKDCHFNLIEFSTKVTQWSDRMVRCTPQTVAVAAQWISKLEAKTGTNTLDALLSAFSDPCCDALYLITDGNPDQNTTDILDSVTYAAQNRPVHSFYVQTGEELDPSSFNFMRELAHETYGSFRTVLITKDGAIDRVTPVFVAEGTGEKIVRSTDGTIFPDTGKYCSLTTTLDAPPRAPDVVIQPVDPYYPLLSHPYYSYPYRCDAFHIYNSYPFLGWSHYRPARAWSKFTGQLADAASVPPPPGPGATLIGTKVLGRRHEDGYFYIGSVKSQLMHDRFLIEFGPTKHGKYKETSYQETYVFDIISHADAMRHAILPNDKVLAPFEPEGQRYGPGIVLKGQEKRCSQGGGEDETIVVSFHNGKSTDVPLNTALWVPTALHDRVTFELQLPSKVRQEFSEQEQYPKENLPGYPTSGPAADPNEFERFNPRYVRQTGPYVYPGGDREVPYYLPYTFPVHYKYIPQPSAVHSEEVDGMVPGTELTKSELNEKVMRQLMEHKMTFEERQERSRLLDKRATVPEASLKKSVTFEGGKVIRDDLSDIEAEYYSGDLELRDSGRGSASDLEVENLEQSGDEEENRDIKDTAVGTSDRLLRGRYRRRYRREAKPRWQYWGTDPTPTLMEPMHFGPYKMDPYDHVVAAAPIELRDTRISKHGLEWATSMTEYVDPYAVQLRNGTVKECIGYMPRPPSAKPQKQGPGQDISDVLGEKQVHDDRMRQARRDFRRTVTIEREGNIQRDRDDKYAQHVIMRDMHKQRILAQIDRERQRHIDQVEKVERAREAKKQINSEIRQRIETNQEAERRREDNKMTALQRTRAQREEALLRRKQQFDETLARRQEVKEVRAQARHDAVQERVTAEQYMNAQREAQARQAKINRIEYFRQKEEHNQKVKELQAHVKNNSDAVFRASVLL